MTEVGRGSRPIRMHYTISPVMIQESVLVGRTERRDVEDILTAKGGPLWRVKLSWRLHLNRANVTRITQCRNL
jgi:hypothetical protein